MNSHLQVGVDERDKSTEVSIHAGVVRLSTANTPGNRTEQNLGGSINDGTAAVALARVLSAFIQSSAEHSFRDVVLTIGGTAVSARDYGDIDLLQKRRASTALS